MKPIVIFIFLVLVVIVGGGLFLSGRTIAAPQHLKEEVVSNDRLYK